MTPRGRDDEREQQPPELVEPPHTSGVGSPADPEGTQPFDVLGQPPTAPSTAAADPDPEPVAGSPAATEAPAHPPRSPDDFPDDVPGAAASLLPLAPPEQQPSELDDLFAASRFREYSADPVGARGPGGAPRDPAPGAALAGALPAPAAAATRAVSSAIGRRQVLMMWIAGSAVALLALATLFFVGTRLGEVSAEASPEPTATIPTEPEPEPTLPLGPIEPGEHPWSALEGGECLIGFEGAWAEEFTVVDCEEPHTAQLVLLGPLADQDPASAFPGAEQVAVAAQAECLAPGAIDLDAAGEMRDLRVSATYPASGADWEQLPRLVGCFATRSSGEALPGDIAGPLQEEKVAAAEAAAAAAEAAEKAAEETADEPAG